MGFLEDFLGLEEEEGRASRDFVRREAEMGSLGREGILEEGVEAGVLVRLVEGRVGAVIEGAIVEVEWGVVGRPEVEGWTVVVEVEGERRGGVELA